MNAATLPQLPYSEMEQPIMGDIGERRRHIELEPVEIPVTVPQEEPVPA